MFWFLKKKKSGQLDHYSKKEKNCISRVLKNKKQVKPRRWNKGRVVNNVDLKIDFFPPQNEGAVIFKTWDISFVEIFNSTVNLKHYNKPNRLSGIFKRIRTELRGLQHQQILNFRKHATTSRRQESGWWSDTPGRNQDPRKEFRVDGFSLQGCSRRSYRSI